MPEIILASFNAHKAEEIRSTLKDCYQILPLAAIGFDREIPEPFTTFKENALHKALTVAEFYPEAMILSEDSGLEIPALKGRPGVYSARYALKSAEESQSQANIRKVLQEMQDKEDRKAIFVATLCLRLPSQDLHFFRGTVAGSIAHEPLGTSDFGYDPIFIPEGTTRSFAQMSLTEKRQYSHRERALNSLQQFLQGLNHDKTL